MPSGILLFPVALVIFLIFNYLTQGKENIKGTMLRCSQGILRTNLRIMLFFVVSAIGAMIVLGLLETIGVQSGVDFGIYGPVIALLVIIMVSEYFFKA